MSVNCFILCVVLLDGVGILVDVMSYLVSYCVNVMENYDFVDFQIWWFFIWVKFEVEFGFNEIMF